MFPHHLQLTAPKLVPPFYNFPPLHEVTEVWLPLQREQVLLLAKLATIYFLK